MPADRVKVQGLRELRASLKDAGGELRDLRAVNGRVGDDLATAGRNRAPVLTGALEGSISGAGEKATAAARATVPYAGVQEFGWPARGIPAQPFLTAALAELEPKIIAAYRAEVDTILARVHGAAGR